MRKIQAERFSNVLDYLKENGIDQTDVVATLYVDFNLTKIDEATISRYKSGKLKIPSTVISAMQKAYNINPDYINGSSKIMFNNAAAYFGQFEKLFKEWSTVEKKYTTKTNELRKENYLYLTMDSEYYNLLQKIDYAKLIEMDNPNCYANYFEELCKKCDNSELHHDKKYILIPCDDFFDIITSQKHAKKCLDEIVDLDKHLPYYDNGE